MKNKIKKIFVDKKINLKMINCYNEFIGKEKLNRELKNIGSNDIYKLKFKNFYYVVAKDNSEERDNLQIFGVFDLNGEALILQDKLMDKLEIVDDKTIKVYKKQDYGYDVFSYEIALTGLGVKSSSPLREDFSRYQSINYVDKSILSHLGVYYLNDYSKENQSDVYFVYDKQSNKKLFTCHTMDFQYSDYRNVEKNKYILITKKIEVLGMQANLKFFIDEFGNLASDIYDEELGLYFKKTSSEDLASLLDKITKSVVKYLSNQAIILQTKDMQVMKVRKRVSELTLK